MDISSYGNPLAKCLLFLMMLEDVPGNTLAWKKHIHGVWSVATWFVIKLCVSLQ